MEKNEIMCIRIKEKELTKLGYKDFKSYCPRMREALRKALNIPSKYLALSCFETPCYDNDCDGTCEDHEYIEIEFHTDKSYDLCKVRK